MELNYRITLSILLLVSVVGIVVCDDDQHEQEPLNRALSEEDEGSCICGLNKDILDRIESIVKSSQSQCHIGGSINSNWQQHLGGSRPASSGWTSSQSSTSNSNANDSNESARPSNGGPHDNNQGQPAGNPLEDEIKNLQNQIAQLMQLSNQNNVGQSSQPSTSSSSSWTSSSGRPQGSQSGYSQIERPPNQAENNQNNLGGSSGNTNDPNQAIFGRPNNSGYNQNGYGGGQNNNNNNNNNAGFGGYGGFNYQIGGRPNQGGYNNWQQLGRPNNGNNNNQPNSGHTNGNNQDNNQGGTEGNGPVHEDPKEAEPINAGFLGGLPPPSSESGENEALNKLNQSQKVDTSDMQSALELTIPNVVSNIFSNIQNLTIQAGHQRPDDGGSNGDKPIESLTSIDGSSASVSGSSTEQITAIGEQLFINWIDHQLQGLHLTASMAAYIQRNALNLFRRIVKQYVERVERMGGKVEDNVRRATQIALNNTQNLISFLLKNYVNFAGGIMKIIGEQVSRVGKQLDSTGETIANINLNPFDIVSNVIDSLPNPSHYSEYFRAFGKYLMGESKGEQQQQQQPQSDQQQQQQQATNENSNNNNQDQRPKGLFSKTMGALSKTLGSWIG